MTAQAIQQPSGGTMTSDLPNKELGLFKQILVFHSLKHFPLTLSVNMNISNTKKVWKTRNKFWKSFLIMEVTIVECI